MCHRSCLKRSLYMLIAGLALNARMRRIDLFCKLVGPLFIALIDGASTKIAIFVTLGMNILSIPIEYVAITQVRTIDHFREHFVLFFIDLNRSITLFLSWKFPKIYPLSVSKVKLVSRGDQNFHDLFHDGSMTSTKFLNSTSSTRPCFRLLCSPYYTLQY